MTLGLISDTHGFLHPRVAEVFGEVDAILHAGDIGPSAILDALEGIAPVYAVWGNVDDAAMRRRVPEHQYLTLEGVRIWMTHIGGHPDRWAPRVGGLLRADPPDVFVCGHSHIARAERVAALGGMLFINPGAAGKQGFHREKTCMRLKIESGRAVQLEVVHLDT